ncbi:MAG: endonuclease [Candidatus Hydrogenedentota bacterium]
MRMSFVLTLLFGSMSAVTALADDFELTVMSFNVRYGTANDGDNAWDRRKDIVVNAIREHAPAVIGTQECLDFQADYIVAKLPEFQWFGVGREADGSGERMAVLYDARVLSPVESGNFWLSETPDIPGTSNWESACHRMATWAKFYHLPTKQFFYFFNTHLDHRSAPAREGGIRVLCDRMGHVPEGIPVILTGDFNSPAGTSEPWKTATSRGFSDAWLVAAERKGPTVTFGRFEAPKEERDARIDWVLTKGPIVVTYCETVLYNESGKYPSDHYPVVARLAISPSK